MQTSYSDPDKAPTIDFAQHAASLGAKAEQVGSISDLEDALGRARQADRTAVVVVETDPLPSTQEGGTWWDVPVAEVSNSADVVDASAEYRKQQEKR